MISTSGTIIDMFLLIHAHSTSFLYSSFNISIGIHKYKTHIHININKTQGLRMTSNNRAPDILLCKISSYTFMMVVTWVRFIASVSTILIFFFYYLFMGYHSNTTYKKLYVAFISSFLNPNGFDMVIFLSLVKLSIYSYGISIVVAHLIHMVYSHTHAVKEFMIIVNEKSFHW